MFLRDHVKINPLPVRSRNHAFRPEHTAAGAVFLQDLQDIGNLFPGIRMDRLAAPARKYFIRMVMPFMTMVMVLSFVAVRMVMMMILMVMSMVMIVVLSLMAVFMPVIMMVMFSLMAVLMTAAFPVFMVMSAFRAEHLA